MTEPKTKPNPNPNPNPVERKSLSMHDGIAVWCDCCTCEAEPYWVEVAQELGIELGSDYVDDDAEAAPDSQD
jgi:hypothetical protein